MSSNTLPKKRLGILFLCQAFYWSTVIVGVAFASLVGLQLAPYQILATLPMASLALGNIVSTLPLSILMQRCGRRAGFLAGSVAMMLGGLLSVYAIFIESFGWFCVGTTALGIAQASAFYYRLAATDEVDETQKGSAMSWVFAGGIIAALIAPIVAIETKDLLLPYQFAGAFCVVVLLGAFSFVALYFLPQQPVITTQKVDQTQVRSIATILKQPQFLLAIMNTAVSNSVMILLMLASPLAILACGFNVNDSTSVIQWHVLGMFLPSFFSGRLIDKLGAHKMAVVGVALLLVSTIIAISGVTLIHFHAALFLLGVGWNILYLSGTTMTVSCHRPEERGKVQGFAEFLVACVSACAALVSGVLLNIWGWPMLNTVVLALLLITLLVNIVNRT